MNAHGVAASTSHATNVLNFDPLAGNLPKVVDKQSHRAF
jgi:hypothetical protein